MKLIASAALITAAAFLATAGATQAQAQSFDQEQTRDIEQIVREYLMQNPDVLIDALREYERRQQAEQQNQRQQALAGLDSFIESIPPEDIVGSALFLEAGLRLACDVAGYDFASGSKTVDLLAELCSQPWPVTPTTTTAPRPVP